MKEKLINLIEEVNDSTNKPPHERIVTITVGNNTKHLLDLFIDTKELLKVDELKSNNLEEFINKQNKFQELTKEFMPSLCGSFNTKYSDNPNEFTISLT